MKIEDRIRQTAHGKIRVFITGRKRSAKGFTITASDGSKATVPSKRIALQFFQAGDCPREHSAITPRRSQKSRLGTSQRRRLLSRLHGEYVTMKQLRQPRLSTLNAQVDAFNKSFAVGTILRVKLDSGQTMDTKTRAPAQVLGGHTAVIWLEGISGCYSLDRCKPLSA